MKNFEQLFEQLKQKSLTQEPNSKTVKLLNKGVHQIGKKIVEEASEVWMASEYQSDDEVAEEIAQLIYHIQVIMLARGLELKDIYKYL